jgi:hypothetical protein
MANGFVHTVYQDGQWINEIEGSGALGGLHARKDEAVQVGRARARQDRTNHAIHEQDRTIGGRNSYGNRPG